jgi:hypothetical protein
MSGDRYWFRAKRYGWGWGFPCRWQGWAVFGLYTLLIYIGAEVARPDETGTPYFTLYVIFLSVLLVGVCWWKGEPPRWRWGGD